MFCVNQLLVITLGTLCCLSNVLSSDSRNLLGKNSIVSQWQGPLLSQKKQHNQALIIRSTEEWEKIWEEDANELPPKAWQTKNIAIAIPITALRGGSSVELLLTDCDVQESSELSWRLKPPDPNTITITAIIDTWFIFLLNHEQECISKLQSITRQQR